MVMALEIPSKRVNRPLIKAMLWSAKRELEIVLEKDPTLTTNSLLAAIEAIENAEKQTQATIDATRKQKKIAERMKHV